MMYSSVHPVALAIVKITVAFSAGYARLGSQ